MNIDAFILAFTLIIIVLCIGFLCSCIQSAKSTANEFRARQKELIAKLKEAELKPDSPEKEELIKEARAFLDTPSNKFRFIGEQASLRLGSSINESPASEWWQILVNESLIGRFFTQEVLNEPLTYMLVVLGTVTGFLAKDLLTQWLATNPGITITQLVVLLIMFGVIISSFKGMITSYIRTYQGDLISGVNYEKIKKKV